MTTYTFCILPDGKLPIGIKETLARVFPTLANKKIRLSINEAKDKRSLDQNAYYWVAIVPHVRQVRFDMGDPVSEETVHEDLLSEFAPRINSKKFSGIPVIRAMRSKEMSVSQFSEYVTAITAQMANFGNPIPIDYEVAHQNHIATESVLEPA